MKSICISLVFLFACALAKDPKPTPLTVTEREAMKDLYIQTLESQRNIERLTTMYSAEKTKETQALEASKKKFEELKKAHGAPEGCELDKDWSWKCPDKTPDAAKKK